MPGGDSIAGRETSMPEGFLGVSDAMVKKEALRRHLESGNHGCW